MALNAGHLTAVSVSASAGSGYANAAGDNSISVSLSRDLIDVTDFGSTHHEQLAALKDSGWSGGGFYDVADAAIVILEAAYVNGTDIWIQAAWSGSSTGHNQKCLMESFDIESSPDGSPSFTFSLKGTANHTTSII